MQQILLIDNFDSFTYNIVHLLEKLDVEVVVWRNNSFDIEDVNIFDRIIISPGPGIPDEAGLSKAVVKRYASTKKILGICLGHQAIGEVFGSQLMQHPKPFHGVEDLLYIEPSNAFIYKDLSSPIKVGRYHSWSIDPEKLGPDLAVTARDSSGNILSIQHRKYSVCGIQFHPESLLTQDGLTLMSNWLHH